MCSRGTVNCIHMHVPLYGGRGVVGMYSIASYIQYIFPSLSSTSPLLAPAFNAFHQKANANTVIPPVANEVIALIAFD